jgi:8-oxo-dGTP pyrophosphatase MutT (NUDIX family)
MPEYTWDGLPIAAEEPNGSTVIVRRQRGREYLILHRARHGMQGDWAWTPPAGARQPGESILAGALRELAEEADISGVDIWPVDLSGGWARFCVEVAADTAVRLVDVEHDQFEWVSSNEAIRRCAPARVNDGIRRADRVSGCDIAFRPLARADLAAMLRWQTAPHVAEWFDG